MLRLYVNAKVSKPVFESQSKHKLKEPKLPPNKISPKVITTVSRWDVIKKGVEKILRAKDTKELKKTERKKTDKIPGYDPSNKKGIGSTLILCEGLSAKTFAVEGISGKHYGRDKYGIYPLTGKILNVRGSSVKSVAKNMVITNMINIMGLSHGTDYAIEKNFRALKYGKVMIITDADSDGIHIEGLIINFFHYFFPTLLERDYVVSMKTPVARVGKKIFYDETKFREHMATTRKKEDPKWIKGLGTTNPSDIKHIFGAKMVSYEVDENADNTMQKVFGKENSDKRKEWIRQGQDENAPSLDDMGKESLMKISDFLNNEMIKFSINDCVRSIPNVIDGLKESQRKILYAAKKKGLSFKGKSIKVAQFGAYTSEITEYHSGEQNLSQAIIGMSQGFVGSNNIPLLYPDGAFGSRLENGKDAASPRYIFTKMNEFTEIIFNALDEPLLDHVDSDGKIVEPYFYVPIIPVILINGCVGIGSGFSSRVLCHKPTEVIDCVLDWINEKKVREIYPWYLGYTGEIEETDEGKYVFYGSSHQDQNNQWVITELPLEMSVSKFMEIYPTAKNYSTPNEVKFIMDFRPSLLSKFSNTNMVASQMNTTNQKNTIR